MLRIHGPRKLDCIQKIINFFVTIVIIKIIRDDETMIKCPEISLLLIGILLILCTGCISENSHDNLANSTKTTQTTAPPNSSNNATLTICPTPGNTTPWIHLDPVTDHGVGENFSIGGTTNLKAGEVLSVFITPYQPSANKKRSYEFTEVEGNTIVMTGNCSTNTWSFSDGLTTLTSGYYIINVTAENETLQTSVWGDFNILETS
jgi:hypothetical protein